MCQLFIFVSNISVTQKKEHILNNKLKKNRDFQLK